MRTFQLLPVLLLIASAGGAGAGDVRRVDIVESGIYAVGSKAVVANKGSPSGTISPVTGERLVRATTTVPARVGVAFGVRYVASGSQRGEEIELTLVTRYPPQGVTNPKTGWTHYSSEYKLKVIVGETSSRFYGLDETWELVPGNWALEFWHEGRKVGEKVFRLVPQS